MGFSTFDPPRVGGEKTSWTYFAIFHGTKCKKYELSDFIGFGDFYPTLPERKPLLENLAADK